MNKHPNTLFVAMAGILMIPAIAFAQLPTPTYGWNLGNTLEATCGEGCWGPPASQALINAVAAAGFNTVRIPCAWNTHATRNQIDPAYMARVKEVVDWCYAKNLTVVINCHWDNGWFENCGFRRFDSKINAKVNAYWTQIANTFKNYDSHLLFAGANEPDVDSAAKTSVLLQYYQTFVNAVRATGGQNTSRWLALPGPSSDIDKTYNWMNSLPKDSTPGRLMIEVHYYTPYQFTLMTSDQSWGDMFYFWGQGYHSSTMPWRNATWGEEDYLVAEFQKMQTKFINNGIPVLLGEYRAELKSGNPELTGADWNLHFASTTYWNKTATDTANSMGLKPCCWDRAGEIFDWTTGAILDSDTLRSLTGGAALPPP